MVDTNGFVSALLRREWHNRQVLRCLEERWQPVMGQALLLEYEGILGRDPVFCKSPFSAAERNARFEAFLSVCDRVHVYYLWRPNLRGAVAGGATAIVTNNLGDFRSADLRFPDLQVLSPRDALQEMT